MLRLLILSLLSLSSVAPPANAQTETVLRRLVAAELRRERCTLTDFALVHRGPLPPERRPVSLIRYSFEGCGGGNNYGTVVSGYVDDGGRPRGLPIDPGPAHPEQIERVAVREGVVTIEGLSHGPDDGRCCPSLRRSQSYQLTGGRFVALPAR